MPTNEKKPRRGHYAKKMGKAGEPVCFIQVDADVLEAFDGDEKAINEALRAMAKLIRRATPVGRRGRRSKAA